MADKCGWIRITTRESRRHIEITWCQIANVLVFSHRSLEQQFVDARSTHDRIREKTFAKRSRTSWDRSFEMLRAHITEMRKVGNAIRAKEINGSWFEYGRLRMEGDYKLGLEAKQPKRVHSTRQCVYIYIYIHRTRQYSPLIAQTSVIRFEF